MSYQTKGQAERTERMRQAIIDMMARGMNGAEIAATLHVTPQAVHYHVRQIGLSLPMGRPRKERANGR